MSVVIKEFLCKAHGAFESAEAAPSCPFGCDTVERIFLTPPAFASSRTKNIDRTLDSLARSHGMTDINNRGGKAAKGQSHIQRRQQEEFNKFIHDRYGDGWGNIPKGGTLNVKTGQVEGKGPGVGGAIAAYHGQSDNALAEVRNAGALIQKPVLMRHDHENLQVKV